MHKKAFNHSSKTASLILEIGSDFYHQAIELLFTRTKTELLAVGLPAVNKSDETGRQSRETVGDEIFYPPQNSRSPLISLMPMSGVEPPTY